MNYYIFAKAVCTAFQSNLQNNSFTENKSMPNGTFLEMALKISLSIHLHSLNISYKYAATLKI